ncbi:MAG: hypothetical protein V7K27_18565 [Nostoc sp.]|uniref:hypothetical protein n=1 Tax=Nostoc sp. TaxID=1180 RepID=UPI002FF8DD19
MPKGLYVIRNYLLARVSEITNGEPALREGFPTQATGFPVGVAYLRRAVLVFHYEPHLS